MDPLFFLLVEPGQKFVDQKKFFIEVYLIEKLPLLELTILPRLTTYADSFSEYVHRRQLYILNSVEVPRDIAKLPHDEILDWIEDYEKRYSDSADGLMQEATELTESND